MCRSAIGASALCAKLPGALSAIQQHQLRALQDLYLIVENPFPVGCRQTNDATRLKGQGPQMLEQTQLIKQRGCLPCRGFALKLQRDTRSELLRNCLGQATPLPRLSTDTAENVRDRGPAATPLGPTCARV